MNAIDVIRQRTEGDIAEYGRTVICVAGEADSLPFAYTIGNWTQGLPELLVIGTARGGFLNDLSRKLIERGRAFQDGQLVGLGGKKPVKIINANQDAQESYTIQAGNYFGTDDYPVQQVLIPDRNGRFPIDPECLPPYSNFPVLRND
jgi:hypothetical protein